MIRELYFQLIPHPLALAVPFVVVAFLLQRSKPGGTAIDSAARFAPWAAMLIFAAFAFAYYRSYSFLDHVEPQVAATAASMLHGGTIYHPMDGSAAYALGYGPLLYLSVEGAYRLFGASLLSAKATTLISTILNALILASIVRRRDEPIARTLGFVVGSGLVFFGALVWLRADPLLLLCASLGWLVAERTPKGYAQVLLGALMGAAASLKLHGGVYLLPPLLWLFARDGWRWTALTPLLGGAIAIAPMLAWESFGRAYVDTLRVNAGHGLVLARWVNNLEFAAFLSAPLWLVFPRGRSGPELRWASLGLVVAFVLVATVASKPGAGVWHFLPLVPSVALLGARAGRNLELAPWRRASIAAWWGVALFLGWTRHDDWIVYLWRDPAREQIAELRQIAADNPGRKIVLGAGENANAASHLATFTRPELVLRGHPYLFDPCAIMDLRKSRYPDAVATPPGILGQRDTLVLIPHGERPFALNNYYGGDVFPASFQAAFLRDYSLRTRGRFFDVWATSAGTR